MKILLVNKFHYLRGGSESYYFALGEALKALGHEVIYFSMRDDKNFPCEQAEYFAPHVGFEAGQSKKDKLKSVLGFVYSPKAGRLMAKLLEKEKPDVAHLNLVHRHLTFSVVNQLKKHNVPTVFTMHDLIALCPCYTMLSNGKLCDKCASGHPINCVKNRCVRGSALMSLLSALEAYYLKISRGYDKVSLFIAPSRFLQKKLINSRFSKSPVLYRCNFLPPDFKYERCEKDGGYLLYLGRLSPEKGVRTLLAAYASLKPDMPLYVAGDGTEADWAKRFVADNKLSDKVKLLGFQDKEHMAELVSKARAVVVPSEWYENCPYSVMEAMGKGKPVIAADIGGIPELVKDGETGMLFKAGDQKSLEEAIERFSRIDGEGYDKMCASALDEARERFSSDNYAKDMTKLYEKLASGQPIGREEEK